MKNKYFKSGWRSEVKISHLGKTDEHDFGWMVSIVYKGCSYILQRDWIWNSCPTTIAFDSEHAACGALAGVDPPWIQIEELREEKKIETVSSILYPF